MDCTRAPSDRGRQRHESAAGRKRGVLPLATARQLAAWGSQQSSIISGRAVLEDSVKMLEQKYAGREVPLPPHWGGWRLSPTVVEFWQGRRSRLHDRLRYRREKDSWVIERLAP